MPASLRPRSRARAAAVAALALVAVLAGCTATTTAVPTASGAPAPRATEIAVGEHPGPVDLQVTGADGVGVTFREIVLPPGATTGVHCHHGQLIGVVEAGELTHYAPTYDTGVHVYRAGDAIVEGPGYRHEGRNEGTTDVVLWVTYVIPEGEPLATTDLAQCDPAGVR